MIIFYFKEALKGIFRAKLGAFIAIITTCFAIFSTILAFFLIVFSNSLENKIKNDISVTLFIKTDIPYQEIHLIKSQIEKIEGIQKITFISKEQAERDFINETGTNFRSILDVNPLPASFIVRFSADKINTEFLNRKIAELKKIYGIDDAAYDFKSILILLEFFSSAKFFIYGLCLLFLAIALYFQYSVDKFILFTKKDQFYTLNLVGAKLKMIRVPIILSNLFLGIISGLICLITFGTLIIVTNKIYLYANFTMLLYISSFTSLILGIIISTLSGFLAVRKISLSVGN